MTGPLSDQQLDEIAERARLAYDGSDPLQTIGYDVPALLVEIRRLRGELAAVWADPTTGTAYDLTATWRDADGAFWRHAGWVGLPGEPRVPLMLWSAVSQPAPGGIRRMSDLATLRAVIDDCGPIAAVQVGEQDEP